MTNLLFISSNLVDSQTGGVDLCNWELAHTLASEFFVT